MFNFLNKNKNVNEYIIKSPTKGIAIKLEKVNDMTFAKKMIGDGIAIIPYSNTFYAPIDSTLVNIFDTKHAYTFKINDDIDLLMHIGIDTVSIDKNLNVFMPQVKENKKVKTDDVITKVDIEKIKQLNIDTTVPIIVIFKDPSKYQMELLVEDNAKIDYGQQIIKITRK